MSTMRRMVAVLLLLCVGLFGARALATDNVKSLYDRQKLETSTGTAVITTTGYVWTGYLSLIAITPPTEFALQDVRVIIDLAKTTTGYATAYTSETITFAVQRKVDGTNWRTEKNTETATITGTAAAGYGMSLFIGEVGPTESVRVVAKVSAEAATNAELPYVVYYRSGARATITPAP